MRRLIIPIIVCAGGLIGCTAQMRVGVTRGQFLPCPETPNCVSSQAPVSDTVHYEAPLPYSIGSKAVIPLVANLVKEGPRSDIITQTDRYIHATYKSAIFRFVDDVEFLVDPKTKVLHMRSLARMGTGDLGVNRRRIRDVKQRLSPQLQASVRSTPEQASPPQSTPATQTTVEP